MAKFEFCKLDYDWGFRNSSALPNVTDSQVGNTMKMDKDRKSSMLLPNGPSSHFNNEASKIGVGSLAAAGSSVIGGDYNLKRF